MSADAVTGPTGLEGIVAAARHCFREFGIHRTRMEDVAERAGMSRQHLYRLVGGRADLLELAVIARTNEIVAELEAGTDPDPDDVAEAIVDYLNRVIELGRRDAEFVQLADAVPRLRVSELLAGIDSPIHEMAARSLSPLLAIARRRGLLREDDEDLVVTWVQGVVTLLTPQEHLGEEMQERLIRAFVLPSLLTG